jgi:hypothetical protein
MTFISPTMSPTESKAETEALKHASAKVLSSPVLRSKFISALGLVGEAKVVKPYKKPVAVVIKKAAKRTNR